MGREEEFEALRSGATSLGDSLKRAADNQKTLNESLKDGGAGLEQLGKRASDVGKLFAGMAGTAGKVLGTLGATGLGAEALEISRDLSKLADGFSDTVTGYQALVDEFDRRTGSIRKLDSDMYRLTASFGGTFKSAQEFRNEFIDVASDVASAKFGHVLQKDMLDAAKSFVSSGLDINKVLGEEAKALNVAGTEWNLLALAVQHAGALGLETSQYINYLSKGVLEQGLTVEESAKQLAMFGDISEKVGLPVDKIASSMQGAVSNFTRFGMTVDMGRPLLEGYADTLEDMGLGLEHAIGLSGDLTSAIGKLSQDYSMAYITMQRGGLDFGSGDGLLSGSIGMRAKMLQSEQMGDQATFGREMVGAIKDTLTSFTGGDIVTVEQAAQDTGLQQTFYVQSELLKQMYGLDQSTSDRTLDLLSKVDKATRDGNMTLADSLSEQINEQVLKQESTLDVQTKMNNELSAQTNYLKNMDDYFTNNREAAEKAGKIGISGGSTLNEMLYGPGGVDSFSGEIMNALMPDEAETADLIKQFEDNKNAALGKVESFTSEINKMSSEGISELFKSIRTDLNSEFSEGGTGKSALKRGEEAADKLEGRDSSSGTTKVVIEFTDLAADVFKQVMSSGLPTDKRGY